MQPYTGRFAPSPTGALHAGSLVAALASWLDARAHRGRWLVRIEDVDRPRCVGGAQALILQQLAQCALVSDAPVLLQSQRAPLYRQALEQLLQRGCAYYCRCSRRAIELTLLRLGRGTQRHAEQVYPGTCRNAGLAGGSRPLACRLSVGAASIEPPAGCAGELLGLAGPAQTPELVWQDRWLGVQRQDVERAVGDFVLQRADGCYSYQLAVVVDDAAQGVSHVVRGADLADNTARQVLLQRALGLATPQYLHTPLVLGADGEKLSKQNGARALDCSDPLPVLRQAAQVLGLDPAGDTLAAWLSAATAQWALRFTIRPA